MRWKAPNVGNTRIKRKFLLSPLTCEVNGTNKRETRWLCMVNISQSFVGKDGWYNNYFTN